MKKFYSVIISMGLFFSCPAQQLGQVGFSNSSTFLWFAIATSQNFLIRITDDGKILDVGTEEASLNNRNYFAPKLRPYSGNITYYTKEQDSLLNGKVKNIGACFFTYYPGNDYPERRGKIKTAGSLAFDYYMKFQDAILGGKIKTIGNNNINYYTSYDNEAFKGKPKAIGSTAINYYSSFDDPLIKGKLKNIGPSQYTWYASTDRREFAGQLKAGQRRQLINGVIYILQQ